MVVKNKINNKIVIMIQKIKIPLWYLLGKTIINWNFRHLFTAVQRVLERYLM